MTTAAEYQDKIAGTLIDFDRVGQIVNGDTNTVVDTDGGQVPSFARIVSMLSVPSVDGFVSRAQLALTEIPSGVAIVRSSGYAVPGDGGAAWYIYDASIDAGYAATFPRSSFITPNGRGYRLRPIENTIDIRQVGGVANAVVASDGTVSAGGDCADAFDEARAVGAALGGAFTVTFPGGSYYAARTLFLISHMTVQVDGTVFGKPASPSGAKGHQRSTVFGMFGVETDADYVTYPGTGDYMISPPRPMVANTVIPLAAMSFVAVSTSYTADLAAGGWVYLSAAYAGWHPVISEFAQIDSVSGATVNVKAPLRNTYDNGTWSLAAWCKIHKRPHYAPGKSPTNGWARTGFRRVSPIFDAHITGNGRIVNLTDYSSTGYASFGVFAFLAIGCSVTGVTVAGGHCWSLDCQDFVWDNFGMQRDYTSAATYPGLSMNGSNGGRVRFRGRGASLVVEEGVNNIDILEPDITGGILRLFAFCQEIRVRGGSIISEAAPPLSFDAGGYEMSAAGVLIDGIRAIGQGAALSFGSTDLLTAHPSTDPNFWPAVSRFFDGGGIEIRGGLLASTLNSPTSLDLAQPIRADGVRVGLDSGGNIGGGVSTIIGTARNGATGAPVGALASAGRPTFPAVALGQQAIDTSNGKPWQATLLRSNYLNYSPNANTIQVNVAFGEEDYFQVGDVVEINVISSPLAYPVGSSTEAAVRIFTQQATMTVGSAVIGVTDTSGMGIGMAVVSEGLPTGTTLLTINSATQITVSANATNTFGSTDGAIVTVGDIIKVHRAVVTAWNEPVHITGSISGTTLTVTATDGVVQTSQRVVGTGVADNTVISYFGTGTGGVGTYTVTVSQSVASRAMELDPNPWATFDPPIPAGYVPFAGPTVGTNAVRTTRWAQ